MIRNAIIEAGLVTNVVLSDPEGDWTPPDGTVLVASETASIGDVWDGTVFTPPTLSPERTRAAIHSALERIDARSVRPLRAILGAQAAGLTPDPTDLAYLSGLEAEADALRASLVA